MEGNIKSEDQAEIQEMLGKFESELVIPQPGQIEQEGDISEIPLAVRLVIKFSGGLIKDRAQAEYFLLSIVFLIVLVSLFFFHSGVESNKRPPLLKMYTKSVLK